MTVAGRSDVPPGQGDGGARVRSTPDWPRSIVGLAAAAILLRLLLFLGRGDYLAFDEGWYLLLARSLYSGDGYSLVGTPHLTLSPLFPVLAGAAGSVLGSWVWGGRLVAAVAAGLLVLPAWSVFRRVASRRTALIASALVAVMPSLAPFVAPFWIGADLWVGAEPLLHLTLFAALATWLAAGERGGATRWAGAGLLFGLAFLARPEAIVVWGLAGLVALAVAAARRSPRRLAGAALMGLGFLVAAAPYWFYLHDATGRWQLTGRSIDPAAALAPSDDAGARAAPSDVIEGMLWRDDRTYEQSLYGLDPTGLRLRSSYWGMQAPLPSDSAAAPVPPAEAGDPAGNSAPTEAGDPAGPGTPGAAGLETGMQELADHAAEDRSPPRRGWMALYLGALGQVFPPFLWPFALIGVLGRRRGEEGLNELALALPLLGTSLAVALLVAVDPRTQLFLVPLLALYAARGFGLLDDVLSTRSGEATLRPGFVRSALAVVAVVWLLGISGQRLYRSLEYGSPHHAVGSQNRAVAEELDDLTGGVPGPVASWHPAIAVFADRDWRVLPYATLPEIVRYEQAAGAGVIVLSAYYPPPLGVEDLGTRYLVLPVPASAAPEPRWRVGDLRGDTIRAVGALRPAPVP